MRMISVSLQFCAWAAMAVYAFWTIAFALPSWTHWRADWQSENTVRYRMTAVGGRIFDGRDLLALLMWWFPPLVAAFCAYMAEAVKSVAIKAVRPKASESRNNIVAACYKKVCHALAAPVPGQRFWLYWCDGLNYAELVGVMIWITVHCVGLRSYYMRFSDGTGARTRTGIRNEVPLSVHRLEWISLSFAFLAFIDLAFLFLPIAHNSFLSVLTSLSYSTLVRYHRWIGHSTMWMVCLHGVFYYFFWISDPRINFWDEFFDFGQHSSVNVFAGSLAGASGVILWVTSLNWCRRKYFEVYYKAHVLGFLGFIFFALLHYSWMWSVIMPGVILYAADVLMRVVQGQNIATARGVHTAQDGQIAVLNLTASKEFSKCPVQELFLQLPSISRWQWHPFTIMKKQDNPDGETSTLTVAFKAYGSWTKEAIKQLSSEAPLPIRVTGAMAGTDVEKLSGYGRIVLVAGGIGATPLISLLQEIIEAKARGDPAVGELQQVLLVWAVRNTTELTVLPADVVAAASNEKWMQVELFHTAAHRPALAVKDVTDTTDKVVVDQASEGGSSRALRPVCPVVALSNGALKFPTASAYWWSIARPVQPKTLGPLYAALVTTVAFLGAFLGLVVVQPMDTEWSKSYNTPDKRYKYGMTAFISMAIQGIGMPMTFVVLPSNIISYLKRSSSPAPTTADRNPTAKAPQALNIASIEDEGSKLCFQEQGLSLPITQGRPNVKVLLEREMSGSLEGDIGVFCAGPSGLINATALIIQDLNTSRQSVAAQPRLHFHKHAFEL